MYSKLQLELEGPDLSYRKSSVFHGVLMEQIDTAYAEELHANGAHPFSQFVSGQDGKMIWTVNTLDEEAYDKIIRPLMKPEMIRLKNGTEVRITGRTLTQLPAQELMQEFYQKKPERYLQIDFLMPTAFKQAGRYVFYPDFPLIYGNLMRRYRGMIEKGTEIDEDTLEQLVKGTELLHYRLRTERFPLEGINITGFKGSIGIKLHGADTLAAYVRMLFRFGEYAGIGIKTGLGMGAMELGRSKSK